MSEGYIHCLAQFVSLVRCSNANAHPIGGWKTHCELTVKGIENISCIASSCIGAQVWGQQVEQQAGQLAHNKSDSGIGMFMKTKTKTKTDL